MFIEQIQCSKCHSREAHKFLPGERFCLECHKEKVVHGFGMEDMACLDCHIYKADAKGVDSKDLKPTRAKCLECHKSGAKVNFPKDGAMKFDCYQCHKPHVKAKVKPGAEDCFSCSQADCKCRQAQAPCTDDRHELHAVPQASRLEGDRGGCKRMYNLPCIQGAGYIFTIRQQGRSATRPYTSIISSSFFFRISSIFDVLVCGFLDVFKRLAGFVL